MLHVVARIFRFVSVFRNIHDVSFSDYVRRAEQLFIVSVQRECFSEVMWEVRNNQPCSNKQMIDLRLYLDENNLLRSKGRLGGADHLAFDTRFPIVLHPKHHYSRLVIMAIHRDFFHAGVTHTLANLRSTFWIVSARRLVRQVLKSCRICRKCRSINYAVPLPPQLHRF